MGVKFRDINTGKIYYGWQYVPCPGDKVCYRCPVSHNNTGTIQSCMEYVHDNPEVVRQFGYEPIYDEAPECITVGDTAATRKEILEKAIRCVCGDRDQQYGTPENSFRAIAEFWEAYLRHSCVSAGTEIKIDAQDVAAMMVLFKMARVATGSYSADSWVDAAGYAACGGEIGGSNDRK